MAKNDFLKVLERFYQNLKIWFKVVWPSQSLTEIFFTWEKGHIINLFCDIIKHKFSPIKSFSVTSWKIFFRLKPISWFQNTLEETVKNFSLKKLGTKICSLQRGCHKLEKLFLFYDTTAILYFLRYEDIRKSWLIGFSIR